MWWWANDGMDEMPFRLHRFYGWFCYFNWDRRRGWWWSQMKSGRSTRALEVILTVLFSQIAHYALHGLQLFYQSFKVQQKKKWYGIFVYTIDLHICVSAKNNWMTTECQLCQIIDTYDIYFTLYMNIIITTGTDIMSRELMRASRYQYTHTHTHAVQLAQTLMSLSERANLPVLKC